MNIKQVKKDHYKFNTYITRERWLSIWYQINELMSLMPENVLEVGPGPGLFKDSCARFGVNIYTLDIDPELCPDIIGSAISIPIKNKAYDVVCAFQMIEHLPYEMSLKAFSEMSRVARSYILISLPDSKITWRYCFHIPFFGVRQFSFARPSLGSNVHKFDGEHYWELNKKGYLLPDVVYDMCRYGEVTLVKSFQVPEYSYHRFLLFKK
jgi:hypothetical protein